MTIRHVQTFYQKRAKQYQRFFVDFLQWEKVLEAFFAENKFLRPQMRILDAGCGTGSVTKVLYRLAQQQGAVNIHFYGFDLTSEMLALFQQWIEEKGAGGIQLRQADVLELQNQVPGDWNNFDWIVCSAMLEYIPEEKREQALRKLKERLHQDGKILLFLTRRTWITRWTGAKLWGTKLFDTDEIAGSLQRVGFSMIQYHPLPKRWDSFMMAVMAGQDVDK